MRQMKCKYATSHEIPRVYSYISYAQTYYGTRFGSTICLEIRGKKNIFYLTFATKQSALRSSKLQIALLYTYNHCSGMNK